MTPIILTIPCLPDLDLSTNRRRSRHYYAQARDTAMERERAAVMLREAVPDLASDEDGFRSVLQVIQHKRFNLAWTLHFPKGMRAWDADGCSAALKVWQDVLTERVWRDKQSYEVARGLGWLKNDSPKYVRRVSYESVPSSPLGPSMTLEIEAVEQ